MSYSSDCDFNDLDSTDPTDLEPAPTRGRGRVHTLTAALIAALALAGCADPGDDAADTASETAADTAAAGAEAPAAEGGMEEPDVFATERPERLTDMIRIEGMSEPLELRLFRTPDGFPLPFSAYVPNDMVASADSDEATAHFTAEFGGTRNEDAFLHLFVFPPGTPLQEAAAAARGYKAGRGVPAGRNVEPIADQLSRPDLEWAVEAYRFLYESEGDWFAGTIGVGERGDRFYMIVQHYPQEYGDGFAPRTAVLLDSWRWDDGARLHGELDR